MSRKNYGYIRLSQQDEKALEILKKVHENDEHQRQAKLKQELIAELDAFIKKHKPK